MATLQLIHDRRGIKKASTPSTLRMMIRHKNTTASIPLEVQLAANQWNGKEVVKHPNEKQLNAVVKKKSSDIETAFMMIALGGEEHFINATEIKESILDKLDPDRIKLKEKEHCGHRFVPYYLQFMERRNAKGTNEIYERALKWIRKYDLEIESKDIEQLDRKWLEGLDKAMSVTNKKNSRSIMLRSVRAVFSHANEEGIVKTDPFIGFDLREETTVKRSMSLETLRTIRDWKVSPWQEEYRDMFMLMFYLVGINAADLFLAKKEQMVDGRLNYKRKKTGKLYSVKIQPEAMAIIEKYQGKDFLLSPMDRYNNYKNYLQHMNKALSTLGINYTTSSEKKGKAIFPQLSTYWSRHTWATLAYEIGIPVDVIGQALGHSDRQHTITMIYIRMDDKKVDEANRKVLDYLAKA
ncbi:MAG: phage integrase SAM-like domain-containing protein [Bacteroidales bacterium]|nr:phage integrase SAM-like domain-containing protein [Bacteroidales bacterium]